MENKKILDVACGGKMFYFNKNDPRVLFCDIRSGVFEFPTNRKIEIKPDVVCNFADLPFKSNSFKTVVFDPPHLIRNTGNSITRAQYGSLHDVPTGYQHIKYGWLYKDWPEMLRKGFAECFRVLKPGGALVFKWNETDIKVSEILALTNEVPIFGHISGKRSNTHWIYFVKSAKKTKIKLFFERFTSKNK